MCKAVEDLMYDCREEGIEVGEEKLINKMKEMSLDELKEFLSQKGIKLDDTPDFTRGSGR